MIRVSLYIWLFVVFLCIRSTLSFANVHSSSSCRIPSRTSSIAKKRLDALSKNDKNSFQSRSKVQLPTHLQAVNTNVFGGVLSGCLHSVTGPDHLAALLPSSVGKSGWYGAKIGAVWGLGHGISATLLGFTVFFLKDKIGGMFSFVEKLTNLAESAVGLSLVAIGLLGVKESLEKNHDDDHATQSGGKATSYRAIFANGLLHGFSWDGAPSIAPAIAMTSWKAAGLFFGAYSVGAMITMSVAAGSIAWLSSRMGQLSNNPDLPKKLSLFSSLVAVAIGIYWLIQPLLHK